MSKYSEQSKKYAIKYVSSNYDRVLVKIRKDAEITRESMKAAADQAGESLNGYILEAVRRRMESGE